MRFFNIDCHLSVIEDIFYIFKKLNHEIDVIQLNERAHIMGRSRSTMSFGNYHINGLVTPTEDMCKSFYNEFKDKLKDYDGFICCYPACYLLLYQFFNKPIIVINCIRYEHPFTRDKDGWDYLNRVISELNSKGLLRWICNNKGDVNYTEYFTNIKGTWIPSLCEYIEKYNSAMSKDKYILAHSRNVNDVVAYCNGNLIHLGGQYNWEDVYKYKGVVQFPYHNGNMSLFEYYTNCIPIFIPSKKFLKDLVPLGKTYTELTFYKYFNIPEPEDKSNPLNLKENLDMWIDTADFYDEENMKYITYFDSYEHLSNLLNTITDEQLLEIRRLMKEHNQTRKIMVYNKWENILNSLPSTSSPSW